MEDKRKIYLNIPLWVVLIIVIIVFAIILEIIRYKHGGTIFASKKLKNTYISIQCNSKTIGINEKIQVNIDSDTQEVNLVSSNNDIIKTEGNTIIGLNAGTAKVYAVYKDIKSNELEFTCLNTTNKIVLSETEISINVGEEKIITATTVSENTENNKIKWKSENEEIAIVEKGKISGISAGETIVIAKNDQTQTEAKCKVIVKEIEAQKISLDETNVELGIGQKYILFGTIEPEDVTYKTYNWKSSNDSILTVENGVIEAKSQGEATIEVITKNNKKASCNFIVRNTPPENEKRFIVTDFDIRITPQEESDVLGTAYKDEELEILKETDDWAKVRLLSSNAVGYTLIKSYAQEKSYYINGVPFLNQMTMGYPTGCEAFSATMAARYAGYDIDVQTIINNTPTDLKGIRQGNVSRLVEKEVVNEKTGEVENFLELNDIYEWVAENPFKYFVGNPTKTQAQGSYGCFAPPIVTALRKSEIPCTDLSGCDIAELYKNIREGKPVIIWCRYKAQDINKGVKWYYPNGNGNFMELKGEHCSVLIGYDQNYVYLNDPIEGQGVKQPREKFEENWHILFDQAIIID